MNYDVSTYRLLRQMAVRQEGAMCRKFQIHLHEQTQAFTSQLETC